MSMRRLPGDGELGGKHIVIDFRMLPSPYHFSCLGIKCDYSFPVQNIEDQTITTSFEQFGVFALYEDLTQGGEEGIDNINIQPRVFSPNSSARPKVDIYFNLGKDSAVTTKVYNTAGRLITILADGEQMNRGINVVSWNGRDHIGNTCPSGLYVVTIKTENKMQTKTVVVINE